MIQLPEMIFLIYKYVRQRWLSDTIPRSETIISSPVEMRGPNERSKILRQRKTQRTKNIWVKKVNRKSDKQ